MWLTNFWNFFDAVEYEATEKYKSWFAEEENTEVNTSKRSLLLAFPLVALGAILIIFNWFNSR